MAKFVALRAGQMSGRYIHPGETFQYDGKSLSWARKVASDSVKPTPVKVVSGPNEGNSGGE